MSELIAEKEIVDLRTEKARTFAMDDGSKTLVSNLTPINYRSDEDPETWTPYRSSIENGRVLTHFYDVKLLTDGIGYEGRDRVKDKNLHLSLEGASTDGAVEIKENTVTYHDVFPETDFQLVFGKQHIKAFTVLKSPAAPKIVRFQADGSKRINKGWDADGKMLDLQTRTEDGRIIQKFKERALTIDPTTRIRGWTADIKYPVILDPTSSFVPVDNAHDGQAQHDNPGYATQDLTVAHVGTVNSHPAPNVKKSAFMVFDVTGIDNFDTINSASLDVQMKFIPYTINGGVGTTSPTAGQAYEVHLHTANGDTAASSKVLNLLPTPYPDPTGNRPLTTAKFVNPAIGSWDKAHSAIQTTGWGTGFRSISVDVKGVVQRNVNDYWYDAANDMCFCIAGGPYHYNNFQITTPTHTGAELEVAMKNHATETEPTLVVNYSAGGGGLGAGQQIHFL